MAFYTNSIGVATFVTLNGAVVLPRQKVDMVVRPGIEESAFYKLGLLGRQFELQSRVDATNKTTAEALRALYRAMIGSDPLQLIQQGVDWDTASPPRRAVVIDVTSRRNAIGGQVGGLGPNTSLAWVTATWSLAMVEYTAP